MCYSRGDFVNEYNCGSALTYIRLSIRELPEGEENGEQFGVRCIV